MKVSSHPAQVVTANKERSYRFQILEIIEKPQTRKQKDLLRTQVSMEDQVPLFIFLFLDFLNLLFNYVKNKMKWEILE